jgi:hypothetical protein
MTPAPPLPASASDTDERRAFRIGLLGFLECTRRNFAEPRE